jgi:hypothetical protein
MIQKVGMSVQSELNTVTSTMTELAARITALVELGEEQVTTEVYAELVAAERTVGALLRRLQRVSSKV